MPTITLEPPKVQTSLVPVTKPKLELRLHILEEILTHMNADRNTIELACAGLKDGFLEAIVIKGRDANGYLRDEVTLSFDELLKNDPVTFNMLPNQSITEAACLKLARFVEYSAATMRRKGLALHFVYRFRPHVRGNPVAYADLCARFGLSDAHEPGCPPGMALRQIYRVSPGIDRGIRMTHASAWRTS